MSLKLERPLACFDLETTSKDTHDARIVSIAIIKENIDGTIEKNTRLINPCIPIPPSSTEIHRITDDMVKSEKTFKEISGKLFEYLKGCDLLTYNGNNFDIPILSEEFLRCGIEFPEKGTHFFDSFSIFLKESPRTLTAAYKKYCDKELEDAHNSLADANATYEVFKQQMATHESIQSLTADELHKYCSGGNRADLSGKILIDENGEYIYSFGKNQGKKVKDDLNYAQWILSSNTFTLNTKNVLSKILDELNNGK